MFDCRSEASAWAKKTGRLSRVRNRVIFSPEIVREKLTVDNEIFAVYNYQRTLQIVVKLD